MRHPQQRLVFAGGVAEVLCGVRVCELARVTKELAPARLSVKCRATQKNRRAKTMPPIQLSG